MSPVEKAQDLVDKFYAINPNNGNEAAKQCALICVNEITNSYTGNLEDGRIDFISHNPIEYWEQVKEEIEKL